MDVAAVKRLTEGRKEFAFLDVRELVPFGHGHPFFAANLPWSILELEIGRLVPRLSTAIVLTDAAGELGTRAAKRLRWLGYTNVNVLEGGARGWEAAGQTLFPEIEVPAKSFGAFARTLGQPQFISPNELATRLKGAGEGEIVVLDARPMDEFKHGNIPGSIDAPAGEALRCFHDLVPDPSTLVIVNCMSATRGILGGLSLAAAAVPNEVRVLHHGTRGWLLDGYTLESGAKRVARPPSGHALAIARDRAEQIRRRTQIATCDVQTLAAWRADPERSTYVFDVRSAAEFMANHLPGAVNAPEGRLIMSPEHYFATRNARLVLTDGDTVRATIAALWLRMMGWGEVAVLELDVGTLGEPPELVRGDSSLDHKRSEAAIAALVPPRLRASSVAATSLAPHLHNYPSTILVDAGSSADYATAHIGGAVWSARSELIARLEALHGDAARTLPVLVTSGHGRRAALAASDLIEAGFERVWRLEGGNFAVGQCSDEPALVSGMEQPLSERVDHWLASSERPGNVNENVQHYLDWETGLLDDLDRAGHAPFENLLWPS